MKLKFFGFLAFLSMAVGLWAQDPLALNAKFKLDTSIRTGTLPNGMKYFIRRNAKPENRAELRLAVNVGATMESDNQQGLAHFVEHMCFNGTKNFKKSELVDYLESIGTKFGPHLNAYTSFDETVYMLQVPTDSAEYLTKGLQILEDWAHNVSFEDVEIDKERGVVTEEWRLGLGASERMMQKYFPIILKDSRYAVRLPIGKPEILKNAPYDTLRAFYRDWYRPELMAVVVVGDIDPAQMEKRVIEQFSKIPATKNGRPVQEWNIPDNDKPLVAVVSDKENPYTVVQLFYKHPALEQKTVGDYRTRLVYELYGNMINARLAELTQKADPPFLYGGIGYGNFLRNTDAFQAYAVVQENGIKRGLETLIEENNRVMKFGFTQSELERAKEDMMRGMERAYNERNKTESRSYAGEYVRHFLEEEPVPGIEFEYEIYKKYVPAITLEEINVLPSKWVTSGKNLGAIVMGVDKEGVTLPTEKELLDIINGANAKDVTGYVDDVVTGPLMEAPAPGKVTSTKYLKDVNATEYTFANGVKAIIKTTDFKNDEVVFSSFGWGGVSLFGEEDNQSADYSSYIVGQSGAGRVNNIQLQKMMKGKIASVNPFIGNYSQGFSGSFSPADVEVAMQLIHLYATQPRKDEDVFGSIIEQQRVYITNRTSDPEEVFNDTVMVTMANYHPRIKPATLQELAKIKLDRSYDIYKQTFNTFNGHTFVFVGNMDSATFLKHAQTYLGSLPGKDKPKKWKNLGIKAPKGKITKMVKKGIEPKASVELKMHGKFDWSMKNRMEFNALINVLRIKLRENLREDKGGVYGVQAYNSMVRIPEPAYTITIGFGCAPENVDSLISNVLMEIEKLKKDGPEEKDLTKVKETMKREREISLKENRFWLSAISQYMQNEDKLSELGGNEYIQLVDKLDTKTIKALANKYLTMENYAQFVLLPEN